MAVATKRIVDDLEAFLQVLPMDIYQPLVQDEVRHELLEVVLDLGRPPAARFPHREVPLRSLEVSAEDIDYVVSRVSSFGGDNRAGIERTLHRISAIRNRQGKVIGLTLRVGRAIFGTIGIIEDLVSSGKSLLLLGRPGVGKTTMLREVARVLADDLKKRVIIVDTSNEIAGDGDIPHPAIGQSRRMQVPTPALQHAVMIEAVENHMPEVIVIDEIGTELEAAAARTIAERGVQLIATAHGNTLENLILNPTLCDLVGGIQAVTLGDEEARRRRTRKTVLERKAPPTFDILIEIQEWDQVAIHPNVAEVVDAILQGRLVSPEVRTLDASGEVKRERLAPPRAAPWHTPPREKPIKVFPFGVGRSQLIKAIEERQAPVALVEGLGQAELVVTSKSFYRRGFSVIKEAEAKGVPLYVLRGNSPTQMMQFLNSITTTTTAEPREDAVASALREVEAAMAEAKMGKMVELTPRNAFIRRLQHQLAQRYGLTSQSQGEEPFRRVILSKSSGDLVAYHP